MDFLKRPSDSACVVLVRRDGSRLRLECPAASSLPEAVVRQMEAIVSSSVKRNIVVLADTAFAPEGADAPVGSPAWTAVAHALPFFGLLGGLASTGHTVSIADASTDLETSCRDADVLIVDSDVSDHVDLARGVMRGRAVYLHDRQTFQLRPVPPREPSASPDAIFDHARTLAARADRRQIVCVRPDHSAILIPCIPADRMNKEQLAQAQRIVPAGSSRNVAVIASTNFVADPSDAQSPPAVAQLRAAGRAIPFFGLILNLASAGNPTWIFEADPQTLVSGCRRADLLFIDSALSDKIAVKVLDEAAAVMRSANVAVYDRKSRGIGLLRSLGGTMDRLTFRD